MGDLTQMINIRTTFSMKKRIIENAEKQGMNLSEYVLFAIESYLNGQVDSIYTCHSQDSADKLNNELLKANQYIEQLKEQMVLERNKIWKEASNTINRYSMVKVQRTEEDTIKKIKNQYIEELKKLATQNRLTQDRLYAYETPILKEVFKFASQNPQIRDYPDVVYFLVHCYYKQINPTQYAIGQ